MSTQLHQTQSTSPRPPAPELDGFEIAPALNSSFIALFAFHHERSELHVEFRSGHWARYKADVGLFREWKAAESVGRFFHARVRNRLEEIPRENWDGEVAGSSPAVRDSSAETRDTNVAELADAPQNGGGPEETRASAATIVEEVSETVEVVIEAPAELSAEEEQLQTTGKTLAEQAAAVKIADQASYDKAAGLFATVVEMEKEITGHYAPMKDAAFKAHRAVCDAEKSMLQPLVTAKARLRQLLGSWDAEQTRIREEAQRQERLLADQRAREATISAAVEAEQQGAEPDEVEMILSTPAPVPVATTSVGSYDKKFVTRQTWVPIAKTTEHDALLLLVKAANENPDAFLPCLQLNMSEIRTRAKNQKAAFKVPGFIARPDTKATAKSLKNGGQ